MTLSWVRYREYETRRRKDNRKSKHFSLKIEMGKASGKTGFRREDQKLSFRHVKL